MMMAIRIGQVLLTEYLPPIVALYLPIYGIGFPLFLILRGKCPVTGQGHTLTIPEFLLLIPVCLFAAYGGNLIGQLLLGLLRVLLPRRPLLPDTMPTGEYPVIQAVLLVVAAPLMEEFVFRRSIMDRLMPFGEKSALVFSALAFGLFHTSVNQVCYAFLLGLVFGYVYFRTGRLRYTVALHILVNGLSTIVLPMLLMRVGSSVSQDMMGKFLFSSVLTEPGVMPLILYMGALFILSLYGAVLFVFGLREHKLSRNGIQIKAVCTTPGFLIFLVCSCLWLFSTL